MRLSLFTPALAGLALIAACSNPVPDGASVIEVKGAYIVEPAAGQDIASGGMVVSVRGEAMSLTEVSTQAADHVELHTMSMENDRMSMQKVDSLPVTPAAPLVMARGGNHMMLFGFDSSLKVGDSVDLILTFDDGQDKEQILVTTAEIIGQGDTAP
ncbi:copper chaperone PCu(A)C [Hyphomonas johnsonii]|uniref:Lipoprotein n=1 Tax=Hyphomonas johnsonii MHS-2 TaxID=1280950 RepID=A0A059FJX6_9PROT|nr:copper chaperone PCu(A)C [Hyphomonas johnsonii]KCZ90788.1 hypothetical protein HJO_13091 [Hyphomonas johnsonii MHS-2]